MYLQYASHTQNSRNSNSRREPWNGEGRFDCCKAIACRAPSTKSAKRAASQNNNQDNKERNAIANGQLDERERIRKRERRKHRNENPTAKSFESSCLISDLGLPYPCAAHTLECPRRQELCSPGCTLLRSLRSLRSRRFSMTIASRAVVTDSG